MGPMGPLGPMGWAGLTHHSSFIIHHSPLPSPVLITRTQKELRAATATPPVLVPTMGGLHAGHTALAAQGVREAARRGSGGGGGGKGETRCVVTVFVNPTQFDVPADFDRYP